jgi:hypothetical protein
MINKILEMIELGLREVRLIKILRGENKLRHVHNMCMKLIKGKF